MDNYEIDECRSCGNDSLKDIISLGNQYIVNFVDSKDEGNRCPLDLVLCDGCKLLQLKHNAPAQHMWGDQYWYKSAINKMIRDDLKDIANKAIQIANLGEDDLVIDIGCNDGTLLGSYNHPKRNLIGFEPSGNVAKESAAKGFSIINDFFNHGSFSEKFGDKKAKVITAISMFYDLENPNQFLMDINKILDKSGLFIIQQNYLTTMLTKNAFDNICHEHREYYSYYSLKQLLDKHGFEVFDVELNDINGGSIRTYIRKKGTNSLKVFDGAANRLNDIIELEKGLKLETEKPYLEFASRIDSIKKELLNFIKTEKEKGKKICALGASTRGNVILQYFEIGPELVDCIFDKNPDKEGKLTVGSWIPITHPENIDKYNPDYQIVLIWHIFKGIGDDEREFVNNGGKFILPLSKFEVVESI